MCARKIFAYDPGRGVLFLGRQRKQICQNDTAKSLGQLRGCASAARSQPPFPGVSPDDDPLVFSAVHAETMSLAEYSPGPRLVEISQEDPHVSLLELLEDRRHLRGKTQRLHEFHLALVQIGDQPVVHLQARINEERQGRGEGAYALRFRNSSAYRESALRYNARARSRV